MLTIEEKYENMRIMYKDTQKRLKEAITILDSYDGSRAIDQWDVELMPSKDWETSARKFVNVYKHKPSLNKLKGRK